ncbi:MAG TPA: hypothetical protein VF062_29475 [Candidatus Limnocylindrales bacterium]
MPDNAFSRPPSRLILVKTSAWLLSKRDAQLLGVRFPPRDTGVGAQEVTYGDLLRGILDPGLDGCAWIRRDPEDETSQTALAAPSDGYLSGEAAGALIDGIEAQVTHAHRHEIAKELGRHGSAQLVLSRHRLFIDAERFRALTGTRPADHDFPDFWVVVDLRFAVRFEQLRCHASISVWSAPPRHRRHRPDAVADDSVTALNAPIDRYKRAFDAVAERAEELLAGHLSEIHMHVFERDYTLPVFWVVVPAEPPTHAMEYLDSKQNGMAWVDWTSARAEELLGQPDALEHTLTRSVLNRNLLVLRRVIRTELKPGEHISSSRNEPTYLVLPGAPDPLTGSSRFQEAAHAEFHAADVITALADLEAEAANRLHLRVRDLEIWNNHLRVYNVVVERGSFLWDALSTHLMIEWGTPFENAHNAVDMLHQVLQQAVADLRHIATLTNQAVAAIDQSAGALQDSYDQRIGERTHGGEAGLRAALTETGQFGRAARLGAEIVKRADQVKTSYDNLLAVIAGAFDERRVREVDGTQRASFSLGWLAALIGLVTILDATINMKPDGGAKDLTIFGGPAHIDVIAFALSGVLGVILLTYAVRLLWQVRDIGKLGTKEFRQLYHGSDLSKWPPWRREPEETQGLWRFLKDTSTDQQKRLRLKHQSTEDAGWARVWNDHDLHRAEDLVDIWDTGTNLPHCERYDNHRKDIEGLFRLIEQWGIHSLVLTERARVMHWFDLPNLTCLYRCCTRIDGSFLVLSDLEDKPPLTMVADIDIILSLMRLGFTREQANDIDQWLLRDGYPSAAAAFKRVRQLGLKVGMDNKGRQAAHKLATTRAPDHHHGDA